MNCSHHIKRTVFAALTLFVLPATGSADDVVPRGGHEEMKNAGVNIMPRPKAWDDIRTPLTGDVSEANPLEVYLCTSFRSPYAYVGMDRYAELQENYHLKVHPRWVYPIAIRDPNFFAKASDYRYLYDPHDMEREAEFHGIPYHADFSGKTWIDPVKTKDIIKVAPKEEQPNIFRLYAVSTLIQTEHPEKSLAWAQRMFRAIYDGSQSMTWPDNIPKILDSIGLDGEATLEKALKNEDKYLAIVEENQKWCHASGHGGVPNAVFRGEPFWGQDRIGTLVWRLKQNGLTRRTAPIPVQ